MKKFYRFLHWKSILLTGGVLFLFMSTARAQPKQPVSYAVAMADSIIKYNPNEFNRWNYVNGTVLRSFIELWKATGEKKYLDYIKSTVDKSVNDDGTINNYKLSDYNIDQIKEGSAVLFLYRETGASKYKTAAELLRRQLKEHPRTSEGAFWHKERYPWQIWLDGLYMGSPFLAEYGEVFDEPEDFDDVINQLLLAHKHTLDRGTGLYYHGWDEKREQEWADTVTGQSPSFWGRAMGWYAMALVDALDYIPADHPKRDSVLMVLKSFSSAIKKYQDSASGLWWQVTDQGGREGNYLESSASCMFVYALAKAVRKSYIHPSYRNIAETGFRGILKHFITTDSAGNLVLGQCCLTAGLGYGRDGSYDYYVHQTKISVNDGKATGPFILAALELEGTGAGSLTVQQGSITTVSIRAKNKLRAAYSDLPIILDYHKLQQRSKGLDPLHCLIKSGETEIPCQVNDADGDGQPEEIVFLADFKAGEKRQFSLISGPEGISRTAYPRRTQAEISHKTNGHWESRKYIGGDFNNVDFLRVPDEHTDHSFYIRYEGPGWESDKVGYRFYLDWRNAIDIFGKLTDKMVLQQVGLDGFDSYHEPANWGMDVFKVGKTLGLGSIALWKDEKVRMVAKTDSVTCRIALNGPLESMIETRYYGWDVDGIRNNLNSKLTILGGSRVTKHQLRLEGDGGIFCTGLIKDKKAGLILPRQPEKGWTYMATWGRQSLNDDSLGIAILVNTKDLVKMTEDSINHVVVLKPEDGRLCYYLLGAWEKEPEGIKTEREFIAYLDALVAILNEPLKIKY